MPFVADHLWRNLVSEDESVFLVPWPEAGDVDAALLADVADLRRVVELGRQARAASGLKNRQPLRQLVVEGANGARAHADEIAEELRVKEVTFGDVEATELIVKPNLPVLGPKLGKDLGAVRAALQAGAFEDLGDGRFRVGDRELGPDEVLVTPRRAGGVGRRLRAGPDRRDRHDARRRARTRGPRVRPDARRERDAQGSGLELTDRIRLSIPEDDLLAFADRIKQETLAVSVESGPALKLEKA